MQGYMREYWEKTQREAEIALDYATRRLAATQHAGQLALFETEGKVIPLPDRPPEAA